MNPLETIMGLLSELSESELTYLTRHIGQIKRDSRPVTDSFKRYPYVFVCAGCDCLVDSERSDAITCSPACRVAAHRNGSAKALRAFAGHPLLEVRPSIVLQSRAAVFLLPESESRIRDGEITLDDIRGDIWRAYWALARKAIETAP
jgi:hypothetical protein